MKKTIITISLLATVAASSAFAQGTVVFGNGNTTKISTNSVVDGSGSGVINAFGTAGGQNFYYALFYSTTTSTVGGSTAAVIGTGGTYAFNASGWNNGSQSVGLLSTNAAGGRLQTSAPNSDGSFSVAGLGGGTAANFVVVGWSANIGSSVAALAAWLAAPTSNGWIGESAVSGTLVTGTLGSTAATALFGTGAPFIQGFTLGLVTVPEPGTLALAALGGASLLMFRRKNK